MAFDQAIKVLITADGAQLAAALSGASARINAFAAKTTSTFVKLGATFGGLSAVGLIAGVSKAIDGFEALNAASQRTGLAVESLSALKYAAEQSETSFEALQKGLIKFARVQDDARDGSKEAARTLAAVGVAASDTVEEGLAKIADAFAALPDGARKTALAVQLFGKSGAELIPLLNNGSAGLAQFRAEAEKLGIVVSSQAAKAADQFNDSMGKVSKAGTALGYTMANAVLPTIGDIATAMGNAATQGEGLTGVLAVLGTGLRRLIESGGAKQGLLDDLVWEEGQLQVLLGLREQLETKRAAAPYTSLNPFADTKASLGRDLDANLQRLMTREEKVQRLYAELYRMEGLVGSAAGKAGTKGRAGADQAKAGVDTWTAAVAATRAEYEKLAASIATDLRQASADPAMKKKTEDATVLDINRLKDTARTALEAGDTKAAEEMIAKAQQINNALLEAGKITGGYYKTQAEALKKLAEDGQKVVNGEPLKLPVAPDLESAKNSGMLASATAQGAVTPIVIPAVVQVGATSFQQDAASPSSTDYATLLEQFKQQNPEYAFATGGLIRGRGTGVSDENLILASNREYMVNARSTAKWLPLLELINKDQLRLPRFATGGLVGGGGGSGGAMANFRFDLNGRSLAALAPVGQVETFARELKREVLKRGRR